MKRIVCLSLIISAAVATAGVNEEIRQCAAALERGERLTDARVEFVIGANFGDGPFPAEYKRTYLRNGRALVNMIYRFSAPRGRLHVGIEALPAEHFAELIRLVQRDLRDRRLSARLTPVSNGDDALRSDPIKAFAVSTDFRHPLTPAEAAQLFTAVDSVLWRRLPNSEIKDQITFGTLRDPGRTF